MWYIQSQQHGGPIRRPVQTGAPRRLVSLFDPIYSTSSNTSIRYLPYPHPYSHDWVRRAVETNPILPRIRELGFRVGFHEVPAACASVLSFATEPGLCEEEDEGGDENEDGDDGELDTHQQGGEGIREELEEEVVGGADEELDEEGRTRRRKLRKPRQPYTVTCALRKTNWFESSMEWEDEYFREVYRVSKPTFWGIVDRIKDNKIFHTGYRKKQRPVHYQLGVFLMRYGISGSHSRHPKLSTSIGEGTVTLYCRRVVRALREHGVEVVTWPTEERKREIKAAFKKKCGLDGIIGAVDGTLCGLETKPRVAGDSYISRKKTLSVNTQAWVDHTGKFIAFQTGWIPARYCEFLLADGGYPPSPYLLIPYNGKELAIDGQRRREFNYRTSRARIVVEWAFGSLKSRFPALRRLGAVRDMHDIYRAIEAMMVVHNICHELDDHPSNALTDIDEDEGEIEDYDTNTDGDQNGNQDEPQEQLTLRNAGLAFRERCLDIVCPQ